MSNLFMEMEEYAKKNNVPIIEKEGLEVLLKIIKEKRPNIILEIGTAIAYSALKMNSVCDSKVISFERENNMILKARDNILKANKEDKIEVIDKDFLEYDESKLPMFDLIYIDGAKAQYYNFFKKAVNNLNENGIIVFDNLLFHDYVFNEEKKKNASKNLKQLIRKLENFIETIKKENGFNFEFIKKGDGIGILKRSDVE